MADLEALDVAEVDMLTLKKAGLISERAKVAKVIKSGELTKKVTLKGVGATAGAKAAIEAVGRLGCGCACLIDLNDSV